MLKVLRSFHDLPIRYKLFVGISTAYILISTAGSTIIYSLVRTTIEENIESELKNSTDTILNMVRTAVEVSIKNHLRAVAERNREIVAHYHRLAGDGMLTEEEAKRQAEAVLLTQRIGDTGYIYCLDSSGRVLVHPRGELVGQDVSSFPFVRDQMARKEGYTEYEWKNPGEDVSRPKALYMTYFQPWDWILSVSSYRSEFSTLVNIEDFRNSILALRFGKTGYSFVVDAGGKLLVHPRLERGMVLDVRDAEGRLFMREIYERKSGKIVYSWMNPGEAVAREKLAVFNTIPELGWIVISSSYLDEFNAPLSTVRDLFAAMVVFSLLLVVPLTGRISSAITNPLQELMNRFSAGTSGDFSVRVGMRSRDELGQLASYFNLFMEKLEHYNDKLQREILERKQAEEGLRLSQEMSSKAFRSSPNGICIISLEDGRFINANDTFLISTGHRREEVVGKTMEQTKIFGNDHESQSLLKSVAKSGRLREYEKEIATRWGELRIGMLSAETIQVRDERCMLLIIEDITDRKHLEREIMEIGDRERQRIGQDLHDDLCSHLIGIQVLSEVLNRKLHEKSLDEAAYGGKITALIGEAIEKARRLARGLCPVHLVAYGLESSLRELCTSVSEVFNVSCALKCREETVLIHDNTVATHLFYIAQEAVQNAIKHGQATRIVVVLSSDGGIIALRVTDNGSGIRREGVVPRGMGLRIMAHRAKMIGASLEVKPSLGGGTLVECCVREPLRREAAR